MEGWPFSNQAHAVFFSGVMRFWIFLVSSQVNSIIFHTFILTNDFGCHSSQLLQTTKGEPTT